MIKKLYVSLTVGLLASMTLAGPALAQSANDQFQYQLEQQRMGYTSQMLYAKPLCQTNEEVFFSCEMPRTHKIVSICISQDLSKDAGYMYYSDGKDKKINLSYPKTRSHPQGLFRFGNLMYAGSTGGSYVSFLTKNAKHIVYSASGSFGFEKQGLITTNAQGNIVKSSLLCLKNTVIEQESAVSKVLALKLAADESIATHGLPKQDKKHK